MHPSEGLKGQPEKDSNQSDTNIHAKQKLSHPPPDWFRHASETSTHPSHQKPDIYGPPSGDNRSPFPYGWQLPVTDTDQPGSVVPGDASMSPPPTTFVRSLPNSAQGSDTLVRRGSILPFHSHNSGDHIQTPSGDFSGDQPRGNTARSEAESIAEQDLALLSKQYRDLYHQALRECRTELSTHAPEKASEKSLFISEHDITTFEQKTRKRMEKAQGDEKETIISHFQTVIRLFYQAQYYQRNYDIVERGLSTEIQLDAKLRAAETEEKDSKKKRVIQIKLYAKRNINETIRLNNTLMDCTDRCNTLLSSYNSDTYIFHFTSKNSTGDYAYNKSHIDRMIDKWEETNQQKIPEHEKLGIDALLRQARDLEKKIKKKQSIHTRSLVKSWIEETFQKFKETRLDQIRRRPPEQLLDKDPEKILVKDLTEMCAAKIKKFEPHVIEEFKKYIMDNAEEKEQKEMERRSKNSRDGIIAMDSGYKGSNQQKLLGYCADIESLITNQDPDETTVQMAIVSLASLYNQVYRKDPDDTTQGYALPEAKEKLFDQIRPLAMYLSYLQKNLRPEVTRSSWDPMGKVVKLPGLKRTLSIASVGMESERPRALARRVTNLLQSDYSFSEGSPRYRRTFTGSLTDEKSSVAGVDHKMSEDDASSVHSDVLPDKQVCAEAYDKMKKAWIHWKKESDEALKEIGSIYGIDQTKRTTALRHSNRNPTAFFAHLVTYNKISYGNSSTDVFTSEDLMYAMDPRFDEFGQRFLQQEWRVKARTDWAQGKRHQPSAKTPDGTQIHDGKHEWLPTATVPRILHTILQKYPKQDQLAWISALDILRTPTSEVAIGFDWKEDIDINDVNTNPTKYSVSQLGVWKFHAGGAYGPQKQLSKGSGTFHSQINDIIDQYLDSPHSRLPELLNALKDFADQELFDGTGTPFSDLTPQAKQLIRNDITEQTQKKPGTATYGKFDLESTTATVTFAGSSETIGTISYKRASNLSELELSLGEIKQHVLKTFENRLEAINNFAHYHFEDYLASTRFDLHTDDYISDALLAQLRGEYTDALESCQKAHNNLVARWQDKHHINCLLSTYMLSCLHRQRGNYEEARTLLLDSHEIITRNHLSVSRQMVESHLELAMFHQEFDQTEPAIQRAIQGRNTYWTLPASERSSMAGTESRFKANHLLATLYYETGDLEEATSCLAENEALLKSDPMRSHPNALDLSLSHRWLEMTLQHHRHSNDEHFDYDPHFEEKTKEALSSCDKIEDLAQRAKHIGAFEFQLGTYYLDQKSDLEKAQQAMERAFSAYEQYPEMYWREIAQAAYELGNLSAQRPENQSLAADYYLRADELYCDHVGHARHPFHLEILQKLFTHYQKQGKQEKFQDVLDRAADVDLSRTLFSSKAADTLVWVAEQYQEIDQYDKAEQAFKHAFEVSSRRRGKTDVATKNICRRLAEFYFEQERYGQAEEWADRLCAYERMDPEQYHSLQTIDLAGDIYTRINRHEDAVELYKLALEKPIRLIAQDKELCVVPMKETPRGDLYRVKIAHLYHEQGRMAEMQEILEPVLPLYEQNEHPYDEDDTFYAHERAFTYQYVALAYQQQGKHELANKYYKKAIERANNSNNHTDI